MLNGEEFLYSNLNVALPPSPSLTLPLNNHFVFTPLVHVLGLTRGVIHSTKDRPPRGDVFVIDSEVSLSRVESVIQPTDFNAEVDVFEVFSKVF